MKKRGELDKSEEIEKEAEKKRHERLQLQTQKQMIHNNVELFKCIDKGTDRENIVHDMVE